MNTITLSRPLHAGLYYFVLSQLDLGSTKNTPDHAWAPFLKRAYLDCPNRNHAQILPLRVDTLEVLKKALGRGIPLLQDATGKSLLWNLKQAISTEEEQFTCNFPWQSRDVTPEVANLSILRENLWGPRHPPNLHLWDCDALFDGTYTQTRSTQRNNSTIIALSFRVPSEDFIFYVLNEELRINNAKIPPGFFEEHAPDLVASYLWWCAKMQARESDFSEKNNLIPT